MIPGYQSVSVSEIEDSEKAIIKLVQLRFFSKEIETIEMLTRYSK